MKTVLNQIEDSRLSKKGKTTLTGQFETEPSNIQLSATSPRAVKDENNMKAISQAPLSSDKVAPTYLEYLKALNRL